MARKKKAEVPEILESGLKDKNLVQKSKPLFSLWESGLSLGEFKILDTYLSRIDSHNPDAREVHFSKGELEAALGVERIRQEVLEERLKHLMGTVVKINDGRKSKGFTMITLFSMAIADKNSQTDSWDIKLRCTEEAKEYFFNIEQIGYLRYKIGVVTKLNSVYSYILFQYLEYNRFRVEWDEDLDELKRIMQCSYATYEQYFRFNGLVLKKCYDEITEKTDCKFTYTPIKSGRKVTKIHFKLATINDTLSALSDSEEASDPEQLSWNEVTSPYVDNPINFYADAAPELNRSELEEVIAVLVTVPDYKLPHIEGGIEIWRWHYLQAKYKVMMRNNAKKTIKHKSAYLTAMIQKDIDSGT